mgnify:FL=1
MCLRLFSFSLSSENSSFSLTLPFFCKFFTDRGSGADCQTILQVQTDGRPHISSYVKHLEAFLHIRSGSKLLFLQKGQFCKFTNIKSAPLILYLQRLMPKNTCNEVSTVRLYDLMGHIPSYFPGIIMGISVCTILNHSILLTRSANLTSITVVAR